MQRGDIKGNLERMYQRRCRFKLLGNVIYLGDLFLNTDVDFHKSDVRLWLTWCINKIYLGNKFKLRIKEDNNKE